MLRNLLLSIVAVIGLMAQSASAQVVYACRNTNGVSFEVAAGATCPRGSMSVSWNVTGPQRAAARQLRKRRERAIPRHFSRSCFRKCLHPRGHKRRSQPPYRANIDT
jgi:hypothetical protein